MQPLKQRRRSVKTEKAAEIAALNDLFRTGIDPNLGQVLITLGISALPLRDQAQIAEKVQTFAAFTDDNPHAELDFGAIEHGAEKPSPLAELNSINVQHGQFVAPEGAGSKQGKDARVEFDEAAVQEGAEILAQHSLVSMF